MLQSHVHSCGPGQEFSRTVVLRSHVCCAAVPRCISCGRAQVELLSSNAAAMATHFSNRGNQIVSNRLLNLAEFKQLTSNRGPSVKVSRGSFKVMAPLNYWSWLQVRGLRAHVWSSRLRSRRAGMQACGCSHVYKHGVQSTDCAVLCRAACCVLCAGPGPGQG